ncbi:Rrf2 family transcriptional regulator [Enterococcus sp. C76]|uniref:Rrf2 family transcriptional regulator n=1 Tax=Enterococcus sp. C76 TaxID=3231334 RepID=UPI0019EE6D97|nr:Rrf2 family transcriptional regulator [Enterococcus faecium]EME3555082.1 Rrf2 family transcriptional regulator [Enterococcus faecium]
MKLSKAFFQTIGIVTMLAQLPTGKSLKSQEMSTRMQVSHSYLLKIAKKLKNRGIITSSASKIGGYSLAKNPDDISFLDLFDAVESNESFHENFSIEVASGFFITPKLVEEKSENLISYLNKAENAYRNVLASYYLSDILPHDEKNNLVVIDWQKILSDTDKDKN